MTDKEIILKTLDYLKYKSGHSEIKDFWTELSISDDNQVRIKIKLEDNNLATPHIYDAWKLMVTTTGLKTKPHDLKDNGVLKKKIIDREFKRGIRTTLLGVFVGFLLTTGLEIIKVKWLHRQEEKTIILPPIQIVHDTVPVNQGISIISGQKK